MRQPTSNPATHAGATLAWLMKRSRQGTRRIETLTFGRLDRIYHSGKATPAIRQAIRQECRRCGYSLTVLAINRWN